MKTPNTNRYWCSALLLVSLGTIILSVGLLYSSWKKYQAGVAGRQLQRKQAAEAVTSLESLEKAYEIHDSRRVQFFLKALARTGDYRVVSILIDAMYCEDDPEIMLSARQSLCQISRKAGGFGTAYPEEMTFDEWRDEIERWKKWYRQVRPESDFEDPLTMLVAPASVVELQHRAMTALKDIQSTLSHD